MTFPSIWHTDLVRARAGDRNALGRLLDAVRNYLRSIARKELPANLLAKEDESDLVQETFVKASQGFEQFRGESPNEWEAWLRRILLHILHSSRREFRTLKRAVGRERSLGETAGRNIFTDHLAAHDAEPVDTAIAVERDAALALALSRLSERHREVIMMRCAEGLSFVEIGEKFCLTENGAQKLWTRAVEHLQQEVGESF